MELLLLPSGKDLHSNCFIFLHPNRYSVNQKFICFCLPACLHSLFAVCFLPARACLKNALRKMCVTICGRFCSDEGVVVGYDNRIRTKYGRICDFYPSDQRFAYSFLQIPSHDEHPCCSAIHFPLSGRVRDFHPLERAHGAQTKKEAGRIQLP